MPPAANVKLEPSLGLGVRRLGAPYGIHEMTDAPRQGSAGLGDLTCLRMHCGALPGGF